MAHAAESCGVARTTLRDRLAGATNRVAAHSHQQNLTIDNEKVVLRWIERLKRSGFPSHIAHVKEAAKRPSSTTTMGKNWITRFLNQHPELSVRLTTTIELKQVQQSHLEIIKDHFRKLRTTITIFNIGEGFIYNMDEKGFWMGLSDRCKVIWKKLGRGGSFKIGSDFSNRELLTVIECVGAGGVVLPPLITYKSAGHYMGWHKLTNTKAADFRFSYSKKGWTNRELGFTWLKDVFERFTNPTDSSLWQLLFVDGHDSHISIEFIEFCQEHR